jgi:hypothetical protein
MMPDQDIIRPWTSPWIWLRDEEVISYRISLYPLAARMMVKITKATVSATSAAVKPIRTFVSRQSFRAAASEDSRKVTGPSSSPHDYPARGHRV